MEKGFFVGMTNFTRDDYGNICFIKRANFETWDLACEAYDKLGDGHDGYFFILGSFEKHGVQEDLDIEFEK